MRHGVRLGLDVGSVRVGVALCDPDGILATPLVTVHRAAGSTVTPEDSDLTQVLTLIDTHEAVEVVVGWPLGLSGEEGGAAVFAHGYARAIAQGRPGTPVRLLDERFTSVDAHRALRESGVRGRAQRGVVDQAAAVLILQSALDSERVSGLPAGREVRRRKPRTARTKGQDT